MVALMSDSQQEPLLVVVDFRVYAWKIQNTGEMIKPLVSDQIYETWVKACWGLLLNYGPITGRLDRPFQVVVCDDDSQTKPYWRSKYLADRGFPEYKGNRPKAKPFGFSQVVSLGLDYIRADRSGLEYFCLPGYEADDLAGLICQLRYAADRLVAKTNLKGKRIKLIEAPKIDSGKLRLDIAHLVNIASREIALCTVDTDWLQLVGDRIQWCNTGSQEPRIRGSKEAVEYALRRLGSEISKPDQIADIKAIKGDPSDNLPPSSPIEVISLLKPPSEYRLLDTLTGLRMASIMANPKANTRYDHLKSAWDWITNQGLPLPLQATR